MNVARRSWGIVAVGLFLLTIVSPATAKYSDGTGEPNDPYQIATAADLIALGETPADYDKHFVMTADIDLDPNLPGGRVFDKAVIAPTPWEGGTSFSGVFDGKGHVIRRLHIRGNDYLGLFGLLGGSVSNLGLEAVVVSGTGRDVGGLVGWNDAGGRIVASYSSGAVSGTGWCGGLVGENLGGIATSYSAASVSGTGGVGGLVGINVSAFEETYGTLASCYSTGSVSGKYNVGGLVGSNECGHIVTSYSRGSVSGTSCVGGLVGSNVYGSIAMSYSSGSLSGGGLGGLVGYSSGGSSIATSFWDIQTSGQTWSWGGSGKTTAEMQTAKTFLDAGWDFVGETKNGTADLWWILEGKDYPRLWWELTPEKQP